MNETLKNKTDINKFLELQTRVKKMPSYKDLKDLHDRVVPPMQTFEKMMYDYSSDHHMYGNMIKAMDQAILLKANKATVIEQEIYTRSHYA